MTKVLNIMIQFLALFQAQSCSLNGLFLRPVQLSFGTFLNVSQHFFNRSQKIVKILETSSDETHHVITPLQTSACQNNQIFGFHRC